MSIVATRPSVSTASSLDRAVSALRRALKGLGYNQAISSEIVSHAFRERSLAGLLESGHIDAEDYDNLTETFANGFDPVPECSAQWDRLPGTWVTAADLLAPIPAKAAPSEAIGGPVAPADSRAFARQVGTYDVRRKPDAYDLESWKFWSAWVKEAYVEPGNYSEHELASAGLSMSGRCS